MDTTVYLINSILGVDERFSLMFLFWGNSQKKNLENLSLHINITILCQPPFGSERCILVKNSQGPLLFCRFLCYFEVYNRLRFWQRAIYLYCVFMAHVFQDFCSSEDVLGSRFKIRIKPNPVALHSITWNISWNLDQLDELQEFGSAFYYIDVLRIYQKSWSVYLEGIFNVY